jgi:hypothetical protein
MLVSKIIEQTQKECGMIVRSLITSYRIYGDFGQRTVHYTIYIEYWLTLHIRLRNGFSFSSGHCESDLLNSRCTEHNTKQITHDKMCTEHNTKQITHDRMCTEHNTEQITHDKMFTEHNTKQIALG